MQPIPPISGIDAGRALERAGQSPAELAPTSSRFAELLAQEPAAVPQPEVGATSTISQLIGQHERTYHQLIKDMQTASIDAHTLTPQEATVKHTEMMFRIVAASAQNNAYSYIAQSCKNGLQTLMKNQ